MWAGWAMVQGQKAEGEVVGRVQHPDSLVDKAVQQSSGA